MGAKSKLEYEVEAFYFLNMDELACSDLDIGEPLLVADNFPYRSEEPSELTLASRRTAKEWTKQTYVDQPGVRSPRCMTVDCPVCGATKGHVCKNRVEFMAVHQRRWNLAWGEPDDLYAASFPNEWTSADEYELAKARDAARRRY